MISNLIQFNYNKTYEKYIEQLKKDGFTEKQIIYLHNNSFPKLTYNINLDIFNIITCFKDFKPIKA